MKTFLTSIVLIFACFQQTPAALILHYDFDSLGTEVTDSGAGSPANATMVGGARLTTNTPGTKGGGALDLSANGGIGNSVSSIGDVQKVDGLSSMTVSLWLNLRGTPMVRDGLIGDAFESFSDPPGVVGGWDLRLSDEQPTADSFGIAFGVSRSFDSGAAPTEQSVGNLGGLNADDRWVFLAVTFDQSDGNRVSLYHGSESDAADRFLTAQMDHRLFDNPDPLLIGDSPKDSNGTSTPMWLDDIRIYDTALTELQLDQVRLANVVPEPNGLLLLWIMPLLRRPNRVPLRPRP